jgi:DNA-binding beta-propeller fold protein YncE
VHVTATAYVVNEDSGTVTPIDTSHRHPKRHSGPPDQAGKRRLWPRGHRYLPDGATVYITPIQTATGRLRKPLKPGSNPRAITISRDGTIAYVANWQSRGTVAPVNMFTGAPEQPIKVGNHSIAIAAGSG